VNASELLSSIGESENEEDLISSFLIPGAYTHEEGNRVVLHLISINDIRQHIVKHKNDKKLEEAFVQLAVKSQIPDDYADLLEFLKERKDCVSVICTERLMEHAEKTGR
jgi:hypothetical protein